MSLSEFKKIYYVEFFHRLYGNCLAGLFGVPLMYFLYKGHLKTPM